MEDLENFKNWWIANRPIKMALHGSLSNYHDKILGVVLYQEEEYQVELFISSSGTEIDHHTHPDVDSMEVFLCGEMSFFVDGVEFSHANIWDSVAVPSESYHGAIVKKEGAAFLSIQKWKNGKTPSSVGKNWSDNNGNTSWKEYKNNHKPKP